MSWAPWVLPKPEKPYPAGDATLVSTALGWRLVNPRAFAAAPATDSIRDGSSWTGQAFEAFEGGNGHLTPQEADVQGPGRAPFGTGSHRITIGESTAQAEIYRTNDFNGTRLADITRLAYSTFAQAKAGGQVRQPSAMRLAVDTNNDGERDHKLYFFPANNAAAQQPIENGVWQNWDVRNGRLSEDGDAGPDATVSWSDYVAANPDATIVAEVSDTFSNGGGLGLLTGGSLSGNNDSQINGEYYVDRVVVGVGDSTTLYDMGANATSTAPAKAFKVEPGHLQGWTQQAFDYQTQAPLAVHQSFVRGAGTAPHGLGSLRFEINDDSNPNRVERLRTASLDGMLVRDLSAFSFSTFQQADAGNDTAQQPVYLRVNIDTDGDPSNDERMYFYPANNGDQQAVAQGTWQRWDAGSGKWNVGMGDTGPQDAVTLEEFLAEHPDARIVANPSDHNGGVAFQLGGGGASQLNGAFYLDDVVIGTASADNGSVLTRTSYDLEPTVIAPTIAIGDAKVVEGNTSVNAVFPVKLNGPADYDVAVNFATTSGTAKGGSDYVTRTGTVVIPKGKTTGAIGIKVVGDKVRESNETFTISLSGPSYGTFADSKATGTIVNDDRTIGLKVAATGSGHLSAAVTTTSSAPKSPVSVYTVDSKGKRTLLAKGTLDASGRLTLKPTKAYKAGTKLTLIAVVSTSAGAYESAKAGVVIR